MISHIVSFFKTLKRLFAGKMIGNDLLENNPIWIVDVGASGGIDSRWAKFTSSFKGVLFEPNSKDYDTLKSNANENLIILNSALSDTTKKIDFNLCKKQQTSSVYFPNFDFLNKFADPERFEVLEAITLEADTLDNKLRENGIEEVDFIKLDAQGSELPILKGSVNSLQNVIGLEIEVGFAPLYKNQPLFNDVDNFVRKMNFELFDLKRVFWKRNDYRHNDSRRGQIVWGDALYFKSPEQILLNDRITEKKIIRSICIYLIYGYLDLAQILSKLALSKGKLSKEHYNTVVIIIAKSKELNLIPNFEGQEDLYDLFHEMARIFRRKSPFSGRDNALGNPTLNRDSK